MNIIPAIDLMAGKCVRLYKGDFSTVKNYETEPLDQALAYQKQGAKVLHIVDLDGARQETMQQYEIISEIVKQCALQIQVGGGIRSVEQLNKLFDIGVSKVVIGSLAIANSTIVKSWLNDFGGDKIVLALDIQYGQDGIPYVKTQGWQKNSDVSLWEMLDDFLAHKLCHVLCTDISRDGTLQGPNIKLYAESCERYPSLEFQASGGIGSLNDLKRLKPTGVASVIIGKALYENQFDLKQANAEVMIC